MCSKFNRCNLFLCPSTPSVNDVKNNYLADVALRGVRHTLAILDLAQTSRNSPRRRRVGDSTTTATIGKSTTTNDSLTLRKRFTSPCADESLVIRPWAGKFIPEQTECHRINIEIVSSFGSVKILRHSLGLSTAHPAPRFPPTRNFYIAIEYAMFLLLFFFFFIVFFIFIVFYFIFIVLFLFFNVRCHLW